MGITGRKKALLIGVLYRNFSPESQLPGAARDVEQLKDLLIGAFLIAFVPNPVRIISRGCCYRMLRLCTWRYSGHDRPGRRVAGDETDAVECGENLRRRFCESRCWSLHIRWERCACSWMMLAITTTSCSIVRGSVDSARFTAIIHSPSCWSFWSDPFPQRYWGWPAGWK